MFGAFPRYLLLSLAAEGVFLPIWSDAMWDEWERVLGEYLTRGQTDVAAGAATRIGVREDRATIIRDFPRSMVDVPLPSCPAGLVLPDPEDWLIIATAIAGRANVIVTENLKDFPASVLVDYGLSACGLDDFCVGLLTLGLEGTGGAGTIYGAVRRHRETLRRPRPWSEAAYRLDGLRAADLLKFEVLIPPKAPI